MSPLRQSLATGGAALGAGVLVWICICSGLGSLLIVIPLSAAAVGGGLYAISSARKAWYFHQVTEEPPPQATRELYATYALGTLAVLVGSPLLFFSLLGILGMGLVGSF